MQLEEQQASLVRREEPLLFAPHTPYGSAFTRCSPLMKTASDYRQHAEDCRKLARQLPAGQQREQLLEMAKTWDELALSRERQIRRYLGTGAVKPQVGEPSSTDE